MALGEEWRLKPDVPYSIEGVESKGLKYKIRRCSLQGKICKTGKG
jgi:hypothetical protein